MVFFRCPADHSHLYKNPLHGKNTRKQLALSLSLSPSPQGSLHSLLTTHVALIKAMTTVCRPGKCQIKPIKEKPRTVGRRHAKNGTRTSTARPISARGRRCPNRGVRGSVSWSHPPRSICHSRRIGPGSNGTLQPEVFSLVSFQWGK